mmetsp:Transcript_28320/g.27256  ORF Transcript_28320/g.27256 Transcript_28320/m.27256 type:complete len:242 (+) Transcript_28320:317-1042(+)
MELAEGGTLEDYLRTKKHNQSPSTQVTKNQEFTSEDFPLTDEETSLVVRQIMTGIGHLHSHFILHRDIKPGNILFKEKNNLRSVVITDFGLAIHLQKGTLHSEERCGTLLYSSPEQASGQIYGKAADVWSCGLMMYEMLTGDHPLWESKKDDRKKYKQKLKEQKGKYKRKLEEYDLYVHNLKANYERLTLENIELKDRYRTTDLALELAQLFELDPEQDALENAIIHKAYDWMNRVKSLEV